jgi:FAD:protein FMN transferase
VTMVRSGSGPGARRVEHVMGTAVGIDIRDDLPPDDLASGLEAAFAWLRWVDDTFSTYKAGSQISRIGRGELAPDDADPEVREVLQQCDSLRAFTGGYFDAQAAPGGALDPSGLVKGWSVEVASALLATTGSRNHCINAGGDVRVRGAPGPGRLWHVGITHPLQPGALTAIVAVTDGAVATSGTAERGPHVFDPHTGRPAAELASATIVGPSLALADAYATAALAMGAAAPAWLGSLEGYESYVVDAEGNPWGLRRIPGCMIGRRSLRG